MLGCAHSSTAEVPTAYRSWCYRSECELSFSEEVVKVEACTCGCELHGSRTYTRRMSGQSRQNTVLRARTFAESLPDGGIRRVWQTWHDEQAAQRHTSARRANARRMEARMDGRVIARCRACVVPTPRSVVVAGGVCRLATAVLQASASGPRTRRSGIPLSM